MEIARFVEVLLAAQSVQRGGSAALNLAYLAAGRYDAYWSDSTKVWDIAAGVLLVQEAGGVVTSLDGGRLSLERPYFLAAATEPLHRDVQEVLARAVAGGK
jgi:myo-inositol-1(or 4)-monophosphatase